MNITLANYPSIAPKVNWSKYPTVQKEVYDQNKAGSLDFEYWKEFLEDEEIKEIVAKHIAVLNTAKGSAKGKAVIAKATKAKTAKASRTTATKKVATKRATSKPKVGSNINPFESKPKPAPKAKVMAKPKAVAKPTPKAPAKPKFKVGMYLIEKTSPKTLLKIKKVEKSLGLYYADAWIEGEKDGLDFSINIVDDKYKQISFDDAKKWINKGKPISKPKATTKAKVPAKPKADPKKAIKAEISTLQKKSAITATAMRKINSISVETIRQMKGLAGDKEMDSLKYERDILKAIVAKDTAKLKRIAKSSNIDANILTDILPKRK